ncbi:MAG: molybdate ABC transporter substrate-binding protein [Gammaproteobacteria bacterium]|nr:MAG: molybdate ABC transporter substrate-binding protein [Gammaproteobacteria bacterium]
MRRLTGLVTCLILALLPLTTCRGDTVTVAAASSLNYALPDLVRAFEDETGHRLRISYSSSGNLTRQIIQGAPFEILLAADEEHPRRLLERGWASALAPYARGSLCLFLRDDPQLRSCGQGLSCLDGLLREGRLERLALANPDHAPYGVAARQLLRRSGLWEGLQGRLAIAQNALQAAQYVISGAARAGIIPAALGNDPALRGRGRCLPLPEAGESALLHVAALRHDAGDAARRLFEWLRAPAAQAILARHGFLPPGPGR